MIWRRVDGASLRDFGKRKFPCPVILSGVAGLFRVCVAPLSEGDVDDCGCSGGRQRAGCVIDIGLGS